MEIPKFIQKISGEKPNEFSPATFIVILLYTVGLIFFMSADSPVRIEFPHIDSSWFMMGGKAWMEGLIPYVDFTDSKGPVLWLIYGIGYLISPSSFHGMLILEILIYYITFLFLYFSAYIILKSSWKAVPAVFISSFFFFLPNVHIEVRAEDINHLLNSILIYFLCKSYLDRGVKPSYFFWTGIIIASAFLIKYNFAFLQIIPLVSLFFFTLQERGRRICGLSLLLFIAGFLLIIFPFFIYFLNLGALNEFVTEYLINTFSTIRNISSYPTPWTYRWAILYFIILICLVSYMPKQVYRPILFRLTIWIWFGASLLMVIAGIHEYYLNLLVIFPIFGICSIIFRLKATDAASSLVIGSIVLAIIVIVATFYKDGEFNDVDLAYQRKKDYGEITRLFAAYKQATHKIPTIAYIGILDRGEHIQASLIPGTKYWALQNGSTTEMNLRNIEDVFSKRPDFVILDSTDSNTRNRLDMAGYEVIYTYSPFHTEAQEDKTNIIYAKKINF